MKEYFSKFQFILISGLYMLTACQKDTLEVIVTEVGGQVSTNVKDIEFINNSTGFAVGGDYYFSNFIIRTDNGGLDWQVIHEDNSRATIEGLDFLNDSIGMLTGFVGVYARTEDGGNFWDFIEYPSYERINAISIVNENHAVLVGGDGYSGGFRAFFDEFWYITNRTETESVFYDVHMHNANDGVAFGYGTIRTTSDGGATFQPVDIRGGFYVSASFPTNQIGYACGLQGSILKTEDGGFTWKKIKKGNGVFSKREHFEHVSFINNNVGVVCGWSGKIYYTNNGGSDWKRIEIGTSSKLYAIEMISETEFVVGGENGELYKVLIP